MMIAVTAIQIATAILSLFVILIISFVLLPVIIVLSSVNVYFSRQDPVPREVSQGGLGAGPCARPTSL